MTRERGFEAISEDAQIPQRQTGKSAGYDLCANAYTVIPARGWALVPTGLTAFMQSDEELQIRPRSGLALKHGITVLNSPGTVDADYYPNHVQVLLHNVTDRDFHVGRGERIAQAVFSGYKVADDDSATKSRTGGFGHTGQ